MAETPAQAAARERSDERAQATGDGDETPDAGGATRRGPRDGHRDGEPAARDAADRDAHAQAQGPGAREAAGCHFSGYTGPSTFSHRGPEVFA